MLLLDDAAQAERAGQMTPAAAALAAAFWPGGLTIVVPQRPDVPWPAVLTGGAATIGLRVPDHAAPRALAREVEGTGTIGLRVPAHDAPRALAREVAPATSSGLSTMPAPRSRVPSST